MIATTSSGRELDEHVAAVGAGRLDDRVAGDEVEPAAHVVVPGEPPEPRDLAVDLVERDHVGVGPPHAVRIESRSTTVPPYSMLKVMMLRLCRAPAAPAGSPPLCATAGVRGRDRQQHEDRRRLHTTSHSRDGPVIAANLASAPACPIASRSYGRHRTHDRARRRLVAVGRVERHPLRDRRGHREDHDRPPRGAQRVPARRRPPS